MENFDNKDIFAKFEKYIVDSYICEIKKIIDKTPNGIGLRSNGVNYFIEK